MNELSLSSLLYLICFFDAVGIKTVGWCGLKIVMKNNQIRPSKSDLKANYLLFMPRNNSICNLTSLNAITKFPKHQFQVNFPSNLIHEEFIQNKRFSTTCNGT